MSFMNSWELQQFWIIIITVSLQLLVDRIGSWILFSKIIWKLFGCSGLNLFLMLKCEKKWVIDKVVTW